jgi:hypothetical protein
MEKKWDTVIPADLKRLFVNGTYMYRWSRKVKGKPIPLQAWIGSEGTKRLRLPDFKTIGT